MKIEKQVNGNQMVITLEGWLDTQAAPEFEEARKSVPEEINDLVIECKSLEYISSSGIRQLVAAHKQMNGNLTLKNVSPEIRDVLDMTGISRRIRIE